MPRLIAYELNLSLIFYEFIVDDDWFLLDKFSIGVICIDVLITYKGWRIADAKSPTAAPFTNLTAECFIID